MWILHTKLKFTTFPVVLHNNTLKARAGNVTTTRPVGITVSHTRVDLKEM